MKLTEEQINSFIKRNWLKLTVAEMSDRIGLTRGAIKHRAGKMKLPNKNKVLKEYDVSDEYKAREKKKEELNTKQKYDILFKKYEEVLKELHSVKSIAPVNTFEIPVYKPTGNNEATAVIVASDWHIAETIKPEEVNGLNEYTIEIAKKRAEQFFQNSVRMISIFGKDIPIKHAILAIIGDIINNMLFEEAMETNSMLPIKEVILAQDILASGIEYILKNSELNLTIVCHSGNHARTVKKPRNASEAGYSLEYWMYHGLARHFKNEKRVTFIIPESYLSYLKVYDMTIAFHHGHDVRYQGGVGGLTIPMNKAIDQWNKAKSADVYVCGHFHTLLDGGNFVANGSMVGWNAYAIAIKAKFEKPKQVIFLIDKKRGKTITAPILFDV